MSFRLKLAILLPLTAFFPFEKIEVTPWLLPLYPQWGQSFGGRSRTRGDLASSWDFLVRFGWFWALGDHQPMVFVSNNQCWFFVGINNLHINNCMLIPKNQVNITKATACCNQLFFSDLVAQVARIYAPGDLSLVNGDSCLQSFTAVR